jgi:transcriptional regulator with XRE-family HTH domain
VAKELRELGKRIKSARLERGMSQERLAEKADLHRTYISSIERGERNVAIVNVLRLARALEMTPSELFKGIK